MLTSDQRASLHAGGACSPGQHHGGSASACGLHRDQGALLLLGTTIASDLTSTPRTLSVALISPAISSCSTSRSSLGSALFGSGSPTCSRLAAPTNNCASPPGCYSRARRQHQTHAGLWPKPAPAGAGAQGRLLPCLPVRASSLSGARHGPAAGACSNARGCQGCSVARVRSPPPAPAAPWRCSS